MGNACLGLKPRNPRKSPTKGEEGRQESAGSSFSTVLKNPSDLSQEEHGERSHLVRMPKCINKDNPPGMVRKDEEVLDHLRIGNCEKSCVQKDSPTEEKVGQYIPCLGGALQGQEKPAEEKRNKRPGTRSINTEKEQFTCLECGECFAQLDFLILHLKKHTNKEATQMTSL